MRLTRFLWTAVASHRLPDPRPALAEYRHTNDRDAVTGAVLFDRPHLFGCAEGSRTVVNRLLRRLIADPTFGGFQLLACAEVGGREFGYWNTVLPEQPGELDAVYLRHGTGTPVQPNRLTADQILGLLRDVNRLFGDPTRSRAEGGGRACAETLADVLTRPFPVAPRPVDSVS